MKSKCPYIEWTFVIAAVAGFVALAMLMNANKAKEIEVTIPDRLKTGDSFHDYIRHFSWKAGVRVEDQTDEFGP